MGEEEVVMSMRENDGGFWGDVNVLIVDLGGMSVFSLEKFKYFLHAMLYFSEYLLKQKLKIFIKTKEQRFKHFFLSSIDLTGLVTSGMWKDNIF